MPNVCADMCTMSRHFEIWIYKYVKANSDVRNSLMTKQSKIVNIRTESNA